MVGSIVLLIPVNFNKSGLILSTLIMVFIGNIFFI